MTPEARIMLSVDPLPYVSLEGEEPPKAPWVAEPFIRKGDIAILGAQPGVGKSTFAAALSVAVSSGAPFLDRNIETPGPVLVLDEEAGPEETRRLYRSAGGAGVKDLHISSGAGLSLGDKRQIARITHAVTTLKPALVILDTWASFIPGSNENDSGEMTERLRVLQHLRDTLGTSFLILHHLRKSAAQGRDELMERFRGSSAIAAQASTLIAAVPVQAGAALDFIVLKRRGGGKKTTTRVQYVENEPFFSLRSLGSPEASETELDTRSRAIKEYMSPGHEYRTRDLCEAAGGTTQSVGKALAHLRSLGVIFSPRRGLWKLQNSNSESSPSGLGFSFQGGNFDNAEERGNEGNYDQDDDT